MDGAGDELFAGAALAEDEHGRRGRGDAAGEAIDLLHALRGADELAEALVALDAALEGADAAEESAALGGSLDHPGERVGIEEGLGDDVVGAGLRDEERALGVLGVDHHHDLDLGVALPHAGEDVGAAHRGHAQIEQEHVDAAGLEQGEGGLAVLRGVDGEALGHEEARGAPPRRGFVVDEEDPRPWSLGASAAGAGRPDRAAHGSWRPRSCASRRP